MWHCVNQCEAFCLAAIRVPPGWPVPRLSLSFFFFRKRLVPSPGVVWQDSKALTFRLHGE